jgi:bifunctional DNA-binding transcriptional regulator/antitoxin component of YhaV-PrlF toxin-antitoxin module
MENSSVMSGILGTDVVRFSTRGRVVIPRRLRRECPIKGGTPAYVLATPQGILLRPVTRAYLRSQRGSLKGSGVMQALTGDRG